MNTTLPQTETPDELDRLFSDFFKAQLQQPWPKAPMPGAAQAVPSELVTVRTHESPRNQPAATRRDSTARARFTLAASVALAVGACWFLSNNSEFNERPGQPVPSNGGSFLPGSSADGNNHNPLKAIEENKAKKDEGNGGVTIDPGTIE